MGARRCALTFDDGPDPVWTPAVLESLDRGAVARGAGHKGEAAAFWLCSPPCTARPLGREMGASWCVRQPDQARNRSARLPVQDERNATAGDRHFRSSVRIQQRSSATAALTLRTSSSSPAAPVDDSSIRDRAAVSPAVARLLLSDKGGHHIRAADVARIGAIRQSRRSR